MKVKVQLKYLVKFYAMLVNIHNDSIDQIAYIYLYTMKHYIVMYYLRKLP